MSEKKLVESKTKSESNERKIIAACLLGGEQFILINNTITEDHFSIRQYEHIFKVYRQIISEGNKLTESAVNSKLVNDLVAQRTFADIVKNEVIEESEIDAVIEVLNDRKLRRELIGCKDLLEKELKNDNPSAVVFERLNQKLSDVSEGSSFEIEHISSVVDAQYPNEEYKERSIEDIGIPTGIPKLDNLTFGFAKGKLNIIAARTSEGKSSLALQCALNRAVKGDPVAIFSLEDSKEEILDRLICCHGDIDNYRLRKRKFKDRTEQQRFLTSLRQIKDLPIEIDESVFQTPFSIFNTCQKLKIKYGGLSLIVIDFIQCISNEREKLEEMSRQFQNYAKLLENTATVLVSQLSRAREYNKVDWQEAPNLSELRGSGTLEEFAHKLWMITSEPSVEQNHLKSKQAILWVRKNKNGPKGSIPCTFHGNTYRFVTGTVSVKENQQSNTDAEREFWND